MQGNGTYFNNQLHGIEYTVPSLCHGNTDNQRGGTEYRHGKTFGKRSSHGNVYYGGGTVYLVNSVNDGKTGPYEREFKRSNQTRNFSLASYDYGRALTALCPNQNKFFEDIPDSSYSGPRPYTIYLSASSYHSEEDLSSDNGSDEELSIKDKNEDDEGKYN